MASRVFQFRVSGFELLSDSGFGLHFDGFGFRFDRVSGFGYFLMLSPSMSVG